MSHQPKDTEHKVKSGSKLIPELQDLSDQYLDPYSYLKKVAITQQFDPKLYQKILAQYETPILELEKSYKAALILKTKLDKQLKIKIDPLYLSTTLTRLKITNGEKMEIILADNFGDIEDDIKTRISIAEDEVYEQCQDFLDFANPKLRQYFEPFAKDYKYQTINDAYIELKKIDSEIYDTNSWILYWDKLVIYLMQKLKIV